VLITVLLDPRIGGTSVRQVGPARQRQKAGLARAVYRSVTSAE
jgi:hypothetical protein